MIDFNEFAEMMGGFIKHNITGMGLDVKSDYKKNLKKLYKDFDEYFGI